MDEPRSSDEAQQQAADELLAEYLRRVEGGEKVDRDEFLRLHPDSAEFLRAYFEGADSMNRRLGTPASAGVANGPAANSPAVSALHGDETIAPRGLAGPAGMPAGPFTILPRQFGRYRVEKLLGTPWERFI
jgi:hypothetical protein